MDTDESEQHKTPTPLCLHGFYRREGSKRRVRKMEAEKFAQAAEPLMDTARSSGRIEWGVREREDCFTEDNEGNEEKIMTRPRMDTDGHGFPRRPRRKRRRSETGLP